MIYILFILIGMVAGMLLMMLVSYKQINELEESLDTQIKLRKNRDKFIAKQMETNLELKDKIQDLKNNIEILVNNLPSEIKEVINSDQTNQ